MTRIARGGWRTLSFAGQQTAAPEPAVPTEWENLLGELALPEEQAVIAIRSGSVHGARLVQFVRVHFCARFVPEEVLEELGLAGVVDGTVDYRRMRRYIADKDRRKREEGELK